ncbi:hypothetical protein AAII07_30125 [Microvirga sp. 0TCS3.31]
MGGIEGANANDLLATIGVAAAQNRMRIGMNGEVQYYQRDGFFAKAVLKDRENLIIVPCGILGGKTPERGEFEGFIATFFPHASVIYIRDLKLTWYARPHVLDLLQWVNQQRRRLAPKMVSMLGLSMGGFCTCAYADLLNVDVALALSPQVRIATSIDRRYEGHYGRWLPLMRTDLRAQQRSARLKVISGTEEWLDLWQAMSLRKEVRAQDISIGFDWGHNTGRELRNRGYYQWMHDFLSGGCKVLQGQDVDNLADRRLYSLVARLVTSNQLLARNIKSKRRFKALEHNVASLAQANELFLSKWTAARSLKFIGRYNEAASLTKVILDRAPTNASVLREALSIAYKAQDNELAEIVITTSEKKLPNDPRLLEEIFLYYNRTGLQTQSVDIGQKIIAAGLQPRMTSAVAIRALEELEPKRRS